MQKTAYELRISDWSSDVCSSDPLVAGRDRLRVHLVSALRLDHVDQFFDDVDVGAFERALLQAAEAVRAGRRGLRRAAGGGFGIEVFALRLQTRGIDEIGGSVGRPLPGSGFRLDAVGAPPLKHSAVSSGNFPVRELGRTTARERGWWN